ncbi:unnamed protein product [Didymodactylos carnosus]|uniref:Uncharacterized protein n=1 Tax=Didymodactylos carnosus TaxID=1234261 RepID=A0A816CMF2_9BILA|nr:unnamed protein product [Didymodactylos carnosus]CAF4514873.1 unnamed protein product [Didymodactylos carnosus]
MLASGDDSCDDQRTPVTSIESLPEASLSVIRYLLEQCANKIAETNVEQLDEQKMDDDQKTTYRRQQELESSINYRSNEEQRSNDNKLPPVALSTKFASNEQHITTTQTSLSVLAEDKMNELCRRILLIPSPIVTSTAFNRYITTASATQCHQAARCLIDAGLLSLQSRLVANNTQYCEVYLKAVPSSSLEILPFMKQLNKFNIDDINEYLATFKTVDTKNATYLTEGGFSLLSTEPYAAYVMDIDKLKIKTPSKKTTARIYSGNSQRPSQIKLQQTQTQSIVLSPQMDEIDKINLQETIIADYRSKRKRSAHSSSIQTRSATKKPRF